MNCYQTSSTFWLFPLLLALSVAGCDAPSAPVLENRYDFEYTEGPFDYSLQVTSATNYTLSWRDNSENRRRYIMTREDVGSVDSRVTLDVTLDDRSYADELPSEGTVFEYSIDLLRFEQATTNTWTIVSRGIERYFKLTTVDEFSGAVFSSLTVDGNALIVWSPRRSGILTRDMRLTTPPLQLENNSNVRTISNEVVISNDRSVICSQVTFNDTPIEDIRCWSTITGQALLDLELPVGNTYSLSRDGYLALFGTLSIQWWRFSDGQLESTVTNLPGKPNEVSRDGTVAFINVENPGAGPLEARPYIIASGQLLDKRVLSKAMIQAPGGRILAACSPLSKGVAFYNSSILFDPGNPATGLIGTLPDAIDCSFSPDMSQVVTYYKPAFGTGGLLVYDITDLDQLTPPIVGSEFVDIARLYLRSRLNITDVEWLPTNKIFTTGPVQSVQEWSLTPELDVAQVDTFLFDR